MKQISTLLVFACSLLFCSAALGQTTTSFNSSSEVSALQANCWRFNGFAYSSTDLASGTGSVAAPVSNLASITTTLLSKPASGDVTVTFTYHVTGTKTGSRGIKVDVLDNTGAYYNNIDKTQQLSTGDLKTVTYSIVAKNVPSTFSVYIEATNIAVEIDNLTISADPAPGGCIAPISTLPVRLMNFQGAVRSNKAQLQWSVADNETGNLFQVLRSADGKTFSESGVVFINGKVGTETYSFADAAELNAVTYYKLKIVNKDGSISYSNVISLKTGTTETTSTLMLLKNPVASTLNFTYTSAATTQSNVTIYSTTGLKVYSSRISSQKGINTVSLNLDNHIAAGTYILEVSNGSERSVARLVKK